MNKKTITALAIGAALLSRGVAAALQCNTDSGLAPKQVVAKVSEADLAPIRKEPVQQETVQQETVQQETVQQEPVSGAPLYDIPLSEELQEYTYSMCEQYDIVEHYEVILGMMQTESNFSPDAVSSTGDYGIMQINACNHSWLKDEIGIVDIMDVKDNIKSGTFIISDLLHTYYDVDRALMAYNMGPAGASSLWNAGIYTSSYSDKVRRAADLIKTSKK